MKVHDGDRLQCGDTVLRFSLVFDHEREALESAWRSSVRDPLTGIHNRKSLEERLAGEIAFAVRHHTPLAIALFDLDHFKRINDTLGHPAGDAVLREVAQRLQDSIRPEDLLARYGGEEFVVVARGLQIEAGWAMAERLRLLIAARRIDVAGRILSVSTSVGVACLEDCGADTTPATLVKVADRRLYRAKAEGRNCVVAEDAPVR